MSDAMDYAMDREDERQAEQERTKRIQTAEREARCVEHTDDVESKCNFLAAALLELCQAFAADIRVRSLHDSK